MSFDLNQYSFKYYSGINYQESLFSSPATNSYTFGSGRSFLYDANGEHPNTSGSYGPSGNVEASANANIVSGIHQNYVGANYVIGDNGGNNLYNQIFYVGTDTSANNVFHSASVGANSYAYGSNTFQVTVNSTTVDAGYGNGSLTVSNGNGFSTAASLINQNIVGSANQLTYQLANTPSTSGTYHVYISTYNVGALGINSTPTLNVNVAAAGPTPPANPAPCYATGTRIRVLQGRTIADVPVEHVCVGDLALTASGKPRPIRWIGSRSYPGLTVPQADRPVRIKAGALGDQIPARDLVVSPDHALLIDGLFVAAGHLVNGTSITRGEAVADLTYWHVELDSHDMLLAENTPAESFLAAPGVHAGFDGTSTGDASLAPVPYAARVEHGRELDALRERLILRAGLSIEPTRFGAVRAWMDRCDGRRVAGWAQDAEHPDAPVCLDIVVDGTVVEMTLAEEYRADIAAAGIGDGRHGFDIELDEPLSPGIPHTVEVRRSADGLRVCAMEVDAAGAWTALLAA